MGCHPRPPGLRPTSVHSLPGPPEPSRRAAGPAPSRRPEGARPARDWRRRGPGASRADAGPEGGRPARPVPAASPTYRGASGVRTQVRLPPAAHRAARGRQETVAAATDSRSGRSAQRPDCVTRRPPTEASPGRSALAGRALAGRAATRGPPHYSLGDEPFETELKAVSEGAEGKRRGVRTGMEGKEEKEGRWEGRGVPLSPPRRLAERVVTSHSPSKRAGEWLGG